MSVKPFPLYTDGVNLYTSFDGGITLLPVGGNGSGITTLTGDVTAGPGSGPQAATISAAAVTNAKLANMAAATIKGSVAGGVPADLTATQANAVLGVPINWYASVLAFVESKASAVVNPLWTAEMTLAPSAAEVEFGSVAGTGSTFLSTSIEGGVLVSQSGATASSSQLCRNKNGGPSDNPQQTFCANMRTSKYAIATRAIVVQTGTTGILHLAGMTDELVNHILLGYVGTTSTTHWCAQVFSSIVDTGVAFDTNYHDFLFIADGTNITFYIGDGTGGNFAQVAQIAQSNAGTNPGHWVGYCENGASGGGNVQHIDKAMAISINAPT